MNDEIEDAGSVYCTGCEHQCIEDVYSRVYPDGRKRYFVVCQHPDKQDFMGRVEINESELDPL